MKEQVFIQKHQEDWFHLEAFFALSNKERKQSDMQKDLPAFYRRLCHQLAVAKERHYSLQLVERLNTLVNACHQQLYHYQFRFQFAFLRFLVFDFPECLRRNRPFVIIGMALFFVPSLLTTWAVASDSDLIYSLMPAEQVRNFESMYADDAETFGRERDAGTDIHMFGYYIYNNIGIAFRTFASGILLGLGSLFFLIYNGLVIGGVMGYMASEGYHSTFFPFVVGHGSFELTAIGLSGAAGLKLGYAILSPGRYTRATALRLAAKDAIMMMYGAFIMLVIAAFLEAFWSSSSQLPIMTKYITGGILWALVIGFFVQALRGRKA